MAEFCKKCFIKTWLTDRERAQYYAGKLKIIETVDVDICEGCCDITNVVDYVEVEAENEDNT